MKKLLLLLVAFVVMLTGCSKGDNQGNDQGKEPEIDSKYDVSIKVNMPGTLASNIPNIAFKTIKIIGNLNGTDIKYIRGIINNLSVIDLSDANIVEGGESYYNITHKTKNNTIGRFMFTAIDGDFKILLPRSITTIEKEAFLACKGLTQITLYDNINTIGDDAFNGCSELIEITIPKYVSEIRFNSFYKCSKLKTVRFPQKLKIIGIQSFYQCENLSELNIPNEVTKIDNSAFSGCKNIKSVVIPNTVTELNTQAFDRCSNLENITLSVELKSLESSVLRGTKISTLVLPDKIETINDYAFQDCTNLKSITLSKNFISFGLYPFSGCVNLIEIKTNEKSSTSKEIDGVIFSNNVKKLLYFFNVNKFTKYTIPSSIETIEVGAFCTNHDLTAVHIPDKVTEIKERAFYGCNKLKEVYSLNPIPPTISWRMGSNGHYFSVCAFDANNKIDKLYVPKGSYSAYYSSWKSYFNSIVEM